MIMIVQNPRGGGPFLVKRDPKKKGRPGMDVTAVRRTTMNAGIANGKGQGQVYDAEQIMESDKMDGSPNGNQRVRKTPAPMCLRCRPPDRFGVSSQCLSGEI